MQHDSEKKYRELGNVEGDVSEKAAKLNLHLEYPNISPIHCLIKTVHAGNVEMSL